MPRPPAPPSIALAKRSLRTVLRDELADRIVSGRIPPGARLNESDIARELGVSQTPIREALLSLEGEAAIEAEARRGFRVQPLTRQEAVELYSLVGRLERFALELRGVPSPGTLAALDRVNTKLGRPSVRPAQALAIDAEWHALLLGDVPSRHLRETIGRLKRLLLRYENAYMKARRNVASAFAQHRGIVATLRRGRLAEAAERLEGNWLAGIGPMCEWLAANGGDDADTTE